MDGKLENDEGFQFPHNSRIWKLSVCTHKKVVQKLDVYFIR